MVKRITIDINLYHKSWRNVELDSKLVVTEEKRIESERDFYFHSDREEEESRVDFLPFFPPAGDEWG